MTLSELASMTCECGCGQSVTDGRRFAHGHNRRGTNRSPETLAKMKAAWADPVRRLAWCAAISKGWTPESKAALSATNTGRTLSAEHRRKIGQGNRGKVRSAETRALLAELNRLDDVTWQNGRAWLHAPMHPARNKRGRVSRARLVAESVIGRLLNPNELVHHINENQADDRPENLRVMDRGDHTRLHRLGKRG